MNEPQHPSGTKFFVGAYAAAPSLQGWNPASEGKFLADVLALDGVAGLEIPFTGALHKNDEPWFLQQLPATAEYIVTTIPGTAARLQADPAFGLGSTSAAGRKAAVEFAGEALDAAHRLSAHTGGSGVRVLELHAAPVADGGRTSVSALTDSLTEISAWDWQGVQIVLEHCDAFTPGRPFAKGFMTLEAEVEAVSRANDLTGRSVKLGINWGRSVIEQRRAGAAVEHIRFLRQAGLLGGLVLSGCSDAETRFGPAWADVHVPPAPPQTGGSEPRAYALSGVLEPASLMTADSIRDCLAAAGTDHRTGVRGIKVAAPPHATVDERVDVIAQTLAIARQCA
ncbi:DUF4862 family protein [Arthrobacter sp. Y81]|uniref:DUF4862 family protein n=1 Tax=Arthrobacter sp. Y81 TaxID=2058897 RepID=UPI000CE32A1B|nr:DUF4862 family protein [Arthrobacter sp. Y81]